MPAKSTAKSTRSDTTKAKTESEAKELSGWKSFEASMLGESESDMPKKKPFKKKIESYNMPYYEVELAINRLLTG